MSAQPPLLLALDLTGTFVFGLNGALTAVRATRLDVVGVVTLGMMTALGGGVIRDVLIGSVPPATFQDWRYFALAFGGGIIAFALSRRLDRLEMPITVLDAVGLSVFAVIGASKASEYGLGVGPAVLLGVITAVGGGTIRDLMIGQIPTVLRSELYAIPALVAAVITVSALGLDVYGLPAALAAAASCFVIRMLGVHFGLNAPRPPGSADTGREGQPR
ncbi:MULTISPECIES: trimeric intracellular cation channel family protein [Mycolicibacterium]|uniref:Trimeric intracellular cation channel family protein n=1 Tax=Mycolicibacterium austroafricanum TaxID=39687 RepID=A0ABT8HPS9_MYCAO|nr:trimeric intracellular cation channel family protein [Mycolicibacterium austroafricanum]MDN4522772.1 trimeric intracellular cation channel family protein [Mycolicibacterium austroafricanum]QRZ06881.1 trimeric intracellular cation channel family protein [Mycolicibacterium austroafricanum]QZT62779.1 trimeric intracellular cation channel family protein [Mycolicibacterium austroafricanum]QZT68363.1 trimeric intracellular cation channel family protein [Mycolicibacterium austroafricanum]